MNEYIKVDEILYDSMNRVELMPLPYELVNGILGLFNIDEMFHFIKNVYRLQPLKSLREEFDDKIIEDGLGTRVQTYIKDDYLELVSLVQILKTVVGPIGEFGYMNSTELGKVHHHYTLFNFLTQHEVYETRPFQKLLGLVNKVIETISRSEEESAIRIIEKQIPSDELGNWILSVAIIQKVAMAVIIDDTDVKNVITRTYNFVNNKLQNKGDTANSIRAKKSMMDAEVGDSDPESVLEAYRIVSELPKGIVVELNWAIYYDILKNPKKFDKNIDLEIFKNALVFTERLYDAKLTKLQIDILGWIFKDVIDPRSLNYVSIESIVGLMALAFSFLWSNGFKDLALLLTAIPNEYDGAVVINITTNRSRLTKELKTELDILYPFKKIIVATTGTREVNLAEISINEVTDEIYKYRWIYSASNEYIMEVNRNTSRNVEVQADLKIRLAELIIFINKR